jgi:hypothetical protein
MDGAGSEITVGSMLCYDAGVFMVLMGASVLLVGGYSVILRDDDLFDIPELISAFAMFVGLAMADLHRLLTTLEHIARFSFAALCLYHIRAAVRDERRKSYVLAIMLVYMQILANARDNVLAPCVVFHEISEINGCV